MQLQTLGAQAVLCVSPAVGDTVFFSTGDTDGKLAYPKRHRPGNWKSRPVKISY
jgi:hypothetical protein